MTQWLKQSTAVTIQFGPFVDKTDGVALETGLVTALDNATTGIRISKNGGTYAARNTATASAYDAMGEYKVHLDATDTNTLGTIKMIFEEAATCLPVWQDFMVVPANVWDSMFGADLLDVNTVTLPTIPANWITAAGINNAALDGKGDWNIGKTGYSIGGTITTLDALNNLDAAGVRTAVGLATANLDTQLADLPTVAEFEARTLVAASYFDPAADTVANVTTVATNADMLTAAAVNAEVDAALADIGLNLLVSTALPTNWSTDITANSALDYLADDGTAVFDRTTDSLQAIADSGGGGPTAVQIRTEIDSNSTQLNTTIPGLIAALPSDIREEVLPKQNEALSDIPFLMLAASDHATPVTSASGITITVDKDGAGFGAADGSTTVTEVGNGIYSLDVAAGDMNAGKPAFRIVATGGTPGAPDDVFLSVVTSGGV